MYASVEKRLSTACGLPTIHLAGYVHKLFVKSIPYKEHSELSEFLPGAKILQSPIPPPLKIATSKIHNSCKD